MLPQIKRLIWGNIIAKILKFISKSELKWPPLFAKNERPIRSKSWIVCCGFNTIITIQSKLNPSIHKEAWKILNKYIV